MECLIFFLVLFVVISADRILINSEIIQFQNFLLQKKTPVFVEKYAFCDPCLPVVCPSGSGFSYLYFFWNWKVLFSDGSEFMFNNKRTANAILKILLSVAPELKAEIRLYWEGEVSFSQETSLEKIFL